MQNYRHYSWILTAFLLCVVAVTAHGTYSPVSAAKTENVSTVTSAQADALRSAVAEAGHLRVIVQLDLTVETEGNLRSPQERQTQRRMIQSAQNQLRSETDRLSGVSFLTEFETLPMAVLEVDTAGLAALEARDDIIAIVEDELSETSLDSALPIIGSPTFNAAGFEGTGNVVAVLDTGVDVDHVAFTTGRNRIVAEGCFSTESNTYGGVHSVCPNGVSESTVAGSADDCIDEVKALGITGGVIDCKHGTHVAGIIGANDGANMVGVAPDVDLIPVQVFSAFDAYGRMLSFTSDQIKGLEYVLTLTEEFNIVAVNMSLGGNYNDSSCDYDARRQAIVNLQSVGVATIIASGNEGYKDGVGKPGCISEAITVGSSNNNDTVSSFSNISEQIDLLAPGSSITSTFPGNGQGNMSGTSMAAPMVAGAWALISESNPNWSINEKLLMLQNSGQEVDDQRGSGTVTGMRRVDLANALGQLEGSLNISIEANNLFFANQSETIAVVVSNFSDIAANDIIVSATFPAGLYPLDDSISGNGTREEQTIFWKNLSLDADESTTLTLNVAGETSDPMVINATAEAIGSTKKSAEDNHTITIKPSAACNIHENFEADWTPTGTGWEHSGQPDGQMRITDQFQAGGTHSIILDDASINGILNSSAIVIPFDTSNSHMQLLDFYWQGHGYYSTYEDTGLYASTNRGKSWFKIKTPESDKAWHHIQIDLAQAATAAGKTIDDSIFIKFQFMGDGPIEPNNLTISSGLIIDELQMNCGAPLTWDGGGNSAAWSDHLNWSPDIVPNGNNVIFDANSPLESEIDAAFTHSIGDLILERGWEGTLTQSAELNIVGNFTQQGGLLVLNPTAPFYVEGDVILSDGALRQTKLLTNINTTFMAITNSAADDVKYGGYQTVTSDIPEGSDEVTVTIAGPIWGETVCSGIGSTEFADINRCFDISSNSGISLTTRIWQDSAEINSGNDKVSEILGSLDSTRGADSFQTITNEDEVIGVYAFTDGSWSDINGYRLGAEGDQMYVEVDLAEPVPVVAQRMSRTPTAVTLSSISSSNALLNLAASGPTLLIGILLMVITLTVGYIHIRKEDIA